MTEILLRSCTVLFALRLADRHRGAGASSWLTIHKASFIIWFGAMTVHVLRYAPRLPRLLAPQTRHDTGLRIRNGLAGRGTRWILLTSSLVAGLIVAGLTLHLAAAWSAAPK